MKPKEFWIEATPYAADVHVAVSAKPKLTKLQEPHIIHVREVVPIDWSKVWETLINEDGVWLDKNSEKKIQQLIELALKGEK